MKFWRIMFICVHSSVFTCILILNSFKLRPVYLKHRAVDDTLLLSI